MFIRWKGKLLLPTERAQDEMFQEDIDLYIAQETLEKGFDCATSKRAKNVFERCIERKGKILKVVAVDTGEHYLIIHVGSFKAVKKKRRKIRR